MKRNTDVSSSLETNDVVSRAQEQSYLEFVSMSALY